MKKLLFTFLLPTIAFAQVGINTTQPSVTLDVSNSINNVPDGVIAPRITGDNLISKNPLYLAAQTGAIVYVTETPNSSTPKTIKVTSPGYYYFDGSIWQTFSTSTSGGSLTGPWYDVATDTPATSNTQSIYEMGSAVGIGITRPTNLLHLKASSNPLRLEGLQGGVTSTDQVLVTNSTGVVKQIGTLPSVLQGLSIPAPTLFTLASNYTNFLNGVVAGGLSSTNMTMTKNAIPGLTYDTSTGTITFPSGLYQMTYVYEATHDATGCTLSSYIVDFPKSTSPYYQRIHSTAQHTEGGLSNHGGTISFTSRVYAGQTWQIRLGRGQSGNCTGGGMTLLANSTQFLVYRIGD